jgi:lysophospholipase L1-like esterase
MRKILKGILIIGFLGLLIIEAIGRYYKLNIYPTYSHSDKYEYALDPNQRIKFYSGNVFHTNSYGMRSSEVSEQKRKILLMGDSVLYGGSKSDNNDVSSDLLQHIFNKKTDDLQVLNISANSWGPDNAAAFLAENDVFDAELIVLVFSSDDAFDNMTHEPIVGVDYRYPDKKSYFVLQDIFGRIIRKAKRTISKSQENQHQINSTAKQFNLGFAKIHNICQAREIPLLVYHHLKKHEIVKSTMDKGGELIKEFCSQNNIPFYSEIDMMPKQEYLGDFIHFNKKGQEYLANNLHTIISSNLNSKGKEKPLK